MRYLLDTNIVSNLIREPPGSIADRIADLGETQVCTIFPHFLRAIGQFIRGGDRHQGIAALPLEI